MGNYWKVELISKTDGKSTLRSCTTRLTQWTRRYYRKCHLVIDKNTWRTYLVREEVEAAVRSLKKRKSPGEDNITAEMIQAGEESSVEMMYTLFKRIFQEKSCPADWGKTIIVPIHKKKDKRDCNNYRGISLLSVPGKVYTSILRQRLKRYV